MNPNIFREYDIRGRFPEDLNAETATILGRAIGTYYRERNAERVAIGRDCRLSSPELRDSLAQGLMSSGVHVVDVGMVPTPLLYYALFQLQVDAGIQITGSHNPADYNGFKICLEKRTLFGPEIREIGEIAASGGFHEGEGSLRSEEIIAPYLDHLGANLRSGSVPRKVVVDGGNGVGGLVAPAAYRAMGVEVEELFCEPDGRFPNHHPDPTIPENLETLVARVLESKADLGIGFDGDADRIGVVDEKGNVIWGDQLMIIFSRDLLERNPGAAVIAEVKCSQALFDDIEKNGGRPIMWKAGHSLIKGKMKEEKALLAGEMSGHLFFAERYFGYDDAVYAGGRLLEILTRKDARMSDFLSDVPRMVNTPEIRMDCPEEKKFQIVESLASEFKKDHQVIDVDGARVLFDGGWGLIRASNTQPVLVLRFEAKDENRLGEIRREFMARVRWALDGEG